MKEQAKELYALQENKLEVQYPFITIKDKRTNDLEHLFDKEKKHVVYSGALGEKQNPVRLFDFFDQASVSTKNTIFHFFSRGDTFNKLKKMNTNSRIHFHGLVEKEHLEELYHKSDVQIIPQKEGTSKGSLPSKLPNLLASDCKVFLITDDNSELKRLFKNNNLDFVVTSWNIKELVNSLIILIDKPIDFCHQKAVAKNFFTIDKMILKLLR